MSDAPVFLYDGDCAFCSSCARFIEKRVRTTARVTPWQFEDLDVLGVSQHAAEEAVQWLEVPAATTDTSVNTGGTSAGRPARVESGTRAISVLLRRAQWYWRPLGWALVIPPISWLAPPVYRWVARHRHRMPGGTAMCALPQAERDRMRNSHLS